ncbi:methyltransferase domain-containing protein [Candidatus Bathyarchaeota archaeon]|nr:methyltransferase domain-containing protein [Candidatus Bathyarchaeota archaeon]
MRFFSYKVFDEHAEKYDSWYWRNPILFKCEAEVIKSLKLNGRGLSIGVGSGILDSQAPIDVGVDPSANMLKLASARGIKPIRAVGEHLPFKNEVFDFTLLTVTICFLDSPEKTILEARRVLRPQGEIAVCIVPRDSSWGKEYMRKAREGHIFYSHAHFYTLGEIKQLLKKNSFRVVMIKSTLSYSPHDEPQIEKPSEDPKEKGFVCIKAVKI